MCSLGQVFKHGSNVTLVNNLLAFLWTSYKSNHTELLHSTPDPVISVSAPIRGQWGGAAPCPGALAGSFHPVF